MRYLNKDVLKSRLEKRINADVASGRVGGALVAVRQCGELAYKGSFGSKTPGGVAPLPMDSLFRIASMTKPITAVAALMLIEEGRLGLYDPVEKYLPFFKELPLVRLDGEKLISGGIASVKPSVFHILTHTSGVGGGGIGVIQQRNMAPEIKAELSRSVDYYAKMGIQFEPGSEVLYSGTAAFDLLVAIIEKITDREFGEFLEKRLFTPLGMTDTTFTPSREQWDRMIDMHDYSDGRGIVGHTFSGCVFEDFPASHALGGAGLVSSLDDYSRFAEMLLREGELDGVRLLSPSAVRLMSTPHVPRSLQPKEQRWGLGVKVVTEESYERLPLGAYGWCGAYGSHFWVDPINRITAVYMKNSQFDGGGGSVTGENFEWDVARSLCDDGSAPQ